VGKKPTLFAEDAADIVIILVKKDVLLVGMEILVPKENIAGIKNNIMKNLRKCLTPI